jgi:hypothetical protein
MSKNFGKPGAVSHCGPAIYSLKYLKAKQEYYGNSNISPSKNILIFKKLSSKRNQNPSRYYNSGTNLKFQHKPKDVVFQKSS